MSAYPPQQPAFDELANSQPAAEPVSSHLLLSDNESSRLVRRVLDDWQNAKNDHEARHQKFLHYEDLWRKSVGMATEKAGDSNFRVPLIQWQLLGKQAKETDALFGDDAEVIAKPVGPTDADVAPKVGLYMTWRVFESMKATSKIMEFNWSKLKFGRAIAYAPYEQKKFEDNGELVTDYEGPGFYPLDPDDFWHPAEQVSSLHEFSWVGRVVYETPDSLLEGEDEGRYYGITENFERILQAARNKPSNTDTTIKDVQAGAEGQNTGGQSAGERIKVYEWYGGWRMLKRSPGPLVIDEYEGLPAPGVHVIESPVLDGEEWDIDKREYRKTELVVKIIPDLNLMIGCQKLRELYPKMPKPRPFVEAALFKTGEYWPPGLIELLVEIERELIVNHNLAQEGGEASTGPFIAARKQTAAIRSLEGKRWEPKVIMEFDNPAQDIVFHNVRFDPSFSVMQEQRLMGYAERVTGLSDQSLGRSIDRPNAPKTARGQILLDENANIRLMLDVRVLREDFSLILNHLWLLDSLYSPEEMFFRVTEEKADGLFDIDKGFGVMTAEERGGKFDFDIRFATSAYSREAEKERAMLLTQTAMSTPLIMQNPQAQWYLLNDIFKKFGNDNFKRYVPKPPDLDVPRDAAEEWTLALEGRPIKVHPLDVDDEHIMQHQQDLASALESRNPDKQAINVMIAHIIEHQKQKQQKLVIAMQAQAAAALMGQTAQAFGGGIPGQEGSPMQGFPQPGIPQEEVAPAMDMLSGVTSGGMQ